jgi:hypothetical protein
MNKEEMASSIILLSPRAIAKLIKQAVATDVNCWEGEVAKEALLVDGMSFVSHLVKFNSVENKASAIFRNTSENSFFCILVTHHAF